MRPASRGEVSAGIIDFEKPAVRAEKGAWQLASPALFASLTAPNDAVPQVPI